MTYQIVFTIPALHDLREIDEYLRRTAGNSVADRLSDEIIAKAESLRAMPLRQRERAEVVTGLRALHVDGYLLFYSVEATRVSILPVLHGSRNITAKLFSRTPNR